MTTAIKELTKRTTKHDPTARPRWLDWREAGKEPGLEEAKEILLSELGDNSEIISKAKLDPSGQLDANTSFIIWDLIENARRLLDYSGDFSFINDLYAQAYQYVSGHYARIQEVVKDATGEIVGSYSHPLSVMTPRGRQELARMSPETREEVADRFISDAKLTIIRWKRVKGTDWKFVAKTIARLCRELRKEWRDQERKDKAA